MNQCTNKLNIYDLIGYKKAPVLIANLLLHTHRSAGHNWQRILIICTYVCCKLSVAATAVAILRPYQFNFQLPMSMRRHTVYGDSLRELFTFVYLGKILSLLFIVNGKNDGSDSPLLDSFFLFLSFLVLVFVAVPLRSFQSRSICIHVCWANK